jgi:hypothetical protein
VGSSRGRYSGAESGTLIKSPPGVRRLTSIRPGSETLSKLGSDECLRTACKTNASRGNPRPAGGSRHHPRAFDERARICHRGVVGGSSRKADKKATHATFSPPFQRIDNASAKVERELWRRAGGGVLRRRRGGEEGRRALGSVV